MLVFSRKRDEATVIRVGGHVIRMTVTAIRGEKVQFGFDAHADVQIHREEVDARIQADGGVPRRQKSVA